MITFWAPIVPFAMVVVLRYISLCPILTRKMMDSLFYIIDVFPMHFILFCSVYSRSVAMWLSSSNNEGLYVCLFLSYFSRYVVN